MSKNYSLTRLTTLSCWSNLKIFLGLFTVLIGSYLNAQVTLINASTDGGFESGVDFPTNNWIAVNGANTTRAWYVGTGQTGFSGARCAFIGNTATTVGTTTAARTVHVYRTITIPSGATNINLNFNYKQAVADNTFDFLRVSMQTTAPVSGTLPSTNIITTLDPVSNATYANFTPIAAVIPNSFATGTAINLVFTWRSDSFSPHAYGAIDNINVTYTAPAACETVLPLAGGTVSGSASVCAGIPFTLNVTGSTGGASGLTYQWESSTDGTNFSDVLGETSPSITVAAGITASTWYQRRTICLGADPDAIVYSNTQQVSVINCTYDVALTSATYTSIQSTGSNFTWQGTSGDDNVSQTLSLAGTSFLYQGLPVTGIQACTNGWATFNTSNISAQWTNDITSSGQNRVLAPFWDDLVVPGQNFANINFIKYQIDGVLGSGAAIITIEWAGIERFNIPGPNLNFQVKLYEASNLVEYIYGDFQGFDGTVPSDYSYTIGYNSSTPATAGANNRFNMTTAVTNHWTATGVTTNTIIPSCNTKFVLTPGVYTGPTVAPTIPAPVNDNSAGAITLAVNPAPCTSLCGTYYSTRNATASAIAQACASSGSVTAADDDVYFSFVATTATDYTIRLRNSPGFDGVLQLLDASLNPISCVDATATGTNNIELLSPTGLTPGATYFLRVFHDGAGSGTSGGQFSICVNEVILPPANDNIGGAALLSVALTCSPTSSPLPSVLAASASPQPVCGGTADDDIWYYWDAVSAQDVVTVDGIGTYNPHVEIFSSSDNTATGTLTSLACINSTSTGGDEVFTGSTLVPGNRYFIRVYHSLGGAANGNFTICVTGNPCSIPTGISASGITITSADINFTSASNVELYYGPTATIVPPTGPTVSGISTSPYTITGLTGSTGYTYYIRRDCGAGSFSNWAGPFTFQTLLANDACADAITINCSSSPVIGSTIGATVDANYVAAGPDLGTNTTERGVWYRIVGDDQEYNITTCDPEGLIGYDTRLTVYEGTCAGLIPLVANDDMDPVCSTGSFRSRLAFSAFSGTDYYLFVHGFQFGTSLSAVGNFELNITCAPACIPQTYNQCANAAVVTPSATCNYQSFTTLCATPTVGLANPAGVSIFATYTDSWFAFTPNSNDFYLNFDYGTATDLRYTIYTGTCGAFVQTPVNGIAADATDIGVFGATAGQTYYLRVGANPGTGTDGTFDFCVRTLPCSTPTSATVTATSQTNVNVVINGGTPGDTYIIEYGPTGHVPGLAGTAGSGGTIVTTNTLNTNITVPAEQNFTFWVRKDCSAASEGYSFNVGPYNVSTFLIVPLTGTNTITACSGTIYDHAATGDYSNGANGTLVVNPTPGALLQLSGSIDTESGWDFVTIFEGAGTTGTQLFNGSGVQTINVQASAPNVPLTIRFTSDGSGTDVGFTLTPTCLEPCSSPLIAGTINGPASACSGQQFTLSMNTQEIGRTYQWQVRTSTTSWVNLVGETGPTLTTSQTVARIYRCRVGCAFIGSTATSPSPQFEVPMATFEQCYCASSYTIGTTDNDAIENVTLGSINNTSGISASPFITTFAPGVGTTTTLTQGSEASGSVTVFSDFGALSVAVWIDFNRNGSYESSERVAQSTATLGGGDTHTFNFIVPPTAQVGTAGMRVRTVFNNGNVDACSAYGYGETENYTVTIATGSANDARPNAQSIAPAVFPGCSNITGNLANATPTQGEPGNDLWYRFTASSNAVRIQLVGAQDCEIELEDNLGNVLAAEDATTANGNEVLAFGGLTAGTQYWVAIRSMNGSPSAFSCCIQALNDSRCDNGPIFSSLCNTFKVDWTGTSNYVVRFTETAAPNATYTYNMNGVTSVPLRLITGLEHNRSYNVSVDAVYTVVDAGGNTSTITATSNETCPISITQHPLTNLRFIDRDPATRAIGAFISSDVSVCAVTNWEWTFELVDEFGVPNGLEGPVSVLANTTSRFIRTSQIPDVLPGNRYRVRVRPIFASGPGVFDDLSFNYLLIAGTAGMVDVFDNTANPEEVYFERNTENGVFAALYPNPNNGDMVNLNLAGIDSDNVNVRIMDASGRIVWTNRYVVEGALNTIIAFDRPLTSGIYLVEMTFDNQVITERMMVTK